MEKPLYKSKKVAIVVGGAIMEILIALIPSVASLEPETLEAIETLLVWLIPMIFGVLGVHSGMDILTTAKGWQAPPREVALGEAKPSGEA